MKAFLLSQNLLPIHIDRFQKLIGNTKVDKALFVSAAAVPYGFEPRPLWVDESMNVVQQFAEIVDETSLGVNSFIPEDLSQYDFIFVCGGNVFYLAYRLVETGFDKKILQYVNNGGVYTGSSAGAIILMKDIELFTPADDPKKAPNIYQGLNLIDFAIIPHVDHKKYQPLMLDIAGEYKKQGYDIFSLRDDQVLIIEGEKKEVL